MAEDWRGRIDRWERAGDVVLFDELREILCGAVCRWPGVPLPGSEVATRTRDFGAMIDGVGAVGPRNWWGMLRRSRAENRIRRVVEQVRSGEREVPEGSAVHVVAFHRGLDGKMLDVATAAVELINVLWPAVHYSVREMSRFRSLQANTLWTC